MLDIFGDATHVAVWRRRSLDSEQEGVQSAVTRKKLVQLVFEADFVEDGCTLDAWKEVPCCATGFRGLPFAVPGLLQDFPDEHIRRWHGSAKES